MQSVPNYLGSDVPAQNFSQSGHAHFAMVAKFERSHFTVVPGVDWTTCRDRQEVWLCAQGTHTWERCLRHALGTDRDSNASSKKKSPEGVLHVSEVTATPRTFLTLSSMVQKVFQKSNGKVLYVERLGLVARCCEHLEGECICSRNRTCSGTAVSSNRTWTVAESRVHCFCLSRRHMGSSEIRSWSHPVACNVKPMIESGAAIHQCPSWCGVSQLRSTEKMCVTQKCWS